MFHVDCAEEIVVLSVILKVSLDMINEMKFLGCNSWKICFASLVLRAERITF